MFPPTNSQLSKTFHINYIVRIRSGTTMYIIRAINLFMHVCMYILENLWLYAMVLFDNNNIVSHPLNFILRQQYQEVQTSANNSKCKTNVLLLYNIHTYTSFKVSQTDLNRWPRGNNVSNRNNFIIRYKAYIPRYITQHCSNPASSEPS